MSRVFGYARVSTTEQSTEAQRLEIKSRGYDVEDTRFISETVSGGVPAMEREQFKLLVQHMRIPREPDRPLRFKVITCCDGT